MDGLNITLLMSHLACSDEPAHPLNAARRRPSTAVRARLPGIRASFANSSGIFLGAGYTHDLVRPGIALYGGNPLAGQTQSHAAGGRLEATVLQTREIAGGRDRRIWRDLAEQRGRRASRCSAPATRTACRAP